MGKRTCTGSGRVIKGHMGPYGRGKCTLNPLNPDNSGAQGGGRSSRGNSDVGSPDKGIGCYPPRRQQDPAPMYDARPSAAPPTREPEPPQIPGHPGPPRLAQLWSTVDSRPSLPIWGPPPQTSRWPAHCSPPDHRREQSCPPLAAYHRGGPSLNSRAGADFQGFYGSHPDLRSRPDYPPQHRSRECSPPRHSRQDAYSFQDPLAELPANFDLRASHQAVWPPAFAQYPDPGGIIASAPGTEHVDKKIIQSALSGEFIEIAELLSTNYSTEAQDFKTVIDSAGNLTVKCIKPKRVITSSFKWLEAWSLYELILCPVYGAETFVEMCNYRLFMLGLFARYKLPYVLNYDYKHRLLLGAQRSFRFSKVTGELYLITFDSLSHKGPRCTKCNSSEHGQSECPNTKPFRAAGQGDLPKPKRTGDRSNEICFSFNDGRCRAGQKCPRRHECSGCGGPDSRKSCPKCSKGDKPAASSST